MRLSGHREKGSSHKRGLQFTPVYLLFAFSLLKRFLGFDHRGQFWSLVHSRPHPAATATELQGHVLPLSVQLRVRTSPALSGPPVGRPGVFWVHLIQIQGSFWVWVAGAWRRRLGFATWAQRRPRWRWRWRRVRRRWSGRDAIGRCTSAGHFKSFPSSLSSSPSVSVFTWGTRSCFKKRDGRQGRQNNTYRHRKQSTCNKQREEQTGEHELGGVKENRKHRIIIPLHVSVHVERTEEKKTLHILSTSIKHDSRDQLGADWRNLTDIPMMALGHDIMGKRERCVKFWVLLSAQTAAICWPQQDQWEAASFLCSFTVWIYQPFPKRMFNNRKKNLWLFMIRETAMLGVQLCHTPARHTNHKVDIHCRDTVASQLLLKSRNLL